MILQTEEDMKTIRGTVFRRPATEWDPTFGYRWVNQDNRMVRVARREIVTDRRYKFNNYHQNCSFDYTPRKRADYIYRFVALGDSFTNDIMLHMAWPETLHHLLNSRREFRNDFEVYSFPTDGGGLVNWHATFKELIDKQFDYDALIIADWGNDLARSWMISDWKDGKKWVIRMEPDRKPRTPEELEAMRPDGMVNAELRSEEEIEALVRRLKAGADPVPMRPEDYPQDEQHVVKVPEGYRFGRGAFIERYGQLRYDMFVEIVGICHEKKKVVIYSPLPTREGLIHLRNGGEKLMPQAQGEWLCEHLRMRYFDGFAAFRDIDNQALIDFYWLKYDGHWNLGASMHYALKLAEWIFETKVFLPEG